MRIALALPLIVLLAGFDFAPPHRQLASPSPPFVAEQFFLGRTEGKGVIRAKLSRSEALAVRSNGHIDPDGTLILDQEVKRASEPVETRVWRFHKLAAGRYRGTISNAIGPVTGEVNGNCLHLRYKMKKGGYQAEQFIYLQPGGRVALNRMTVKKFGMTLATVEETIRRVS